MQNAQLNLANKLTGRDGGFGRSLFTKAYPKLGDLTSTLHEISDTLLLLNDNLNYLKQSIDTDVQNLVNNIIIHDINESKLAKKKVDKDYELYENHIINSLSSRSAQYNVNVDLMCELRKNCELSRFGLVVELNKQECNKKIILTKLSLKLFHIFQEYNNNNISVLNDKMNSNIITNIVNNMDEVSQSYATQDMLWDRVRARLQGELMGAMPAPGSPAGALSPLCPRTHQVHIFYLPIV